MILGSGYKGVNLNKNTKIWLNYAVGAVVSGILLWTIWLQVGKQIAQLDGRDWWQQGNRLFLFLGLAMMPLNLCTEAYKWKILAGSAQAITYWQALKSLVAGIAISLLTPNRIGEYPGRIIYLQRKNTVRLISVSILGAFAQFFTLFIYGLGGLIYYNITFPGTWQKLILLGCVVVTAVIGLLFWRFENWAVYFEKIKILRRFITYGQLLKRFNSKELITVLGLSMGRFAIYAVQYLMLLRWMNIDMGLPEGFLMASLFFWAIAVIPSIALAELGIRGKVSLYLFGHFTADSIGILCATIGIWAINVILPAIMGSILLIRLKFWR
jgi:hypothetical protein